MSAERKRIAWPLPRLWPFFACSVLLTALSALVVRAQNPAPNVQYTNKAVDLGLRGNLTVNPSTRAVEIQIPLGSYSGRAGFNVPIAISYSSKVHRIKYEAYNPGHYTSSGAPIGDGYTMVSDRFAEYSSAGWTTSVGFPVQDLSAQGEKYDMFGQAVGPDGQCPGGPCLTIDRILFRMPDGSTHELRSSDQPRSPSDPLLDNYYSVDGSRMHYQSSTQKLFMADGSCYNFGTNKYVDRNGNTITDTDTLNRAIANPPMAGTGIYGGTPGDYAYSLPGIGGSINYTFKWRYLDDPGVLTSQQPLQYIADSRCPPGNGSFSPHLFLSDPNGTHTCIVNGDGLFRPVVLYQIVLPHDPANPNPPTYTFTYNIYGEIDKVQLPTGGYERYEYGQVDPLVTDMRPPYLQGNRGITRRYVSASGLPADEVSWQYSGSGGSVNITAPDGSLTALAMYLDPSLQGTFGYSPDQPRAGRTSSENFYSPPDGNGVRHLLRRHLNEWSATGSNATSQFSGAQQAARNARLTKEVEIIFDTGGGALARSTVHEYDLTYQFSTGVNETATKEYDYVVLDQTTAQTIDIASVPTVALLRRTEKTYLDATNAAYRDRNLLGLVASVTVKDAAGNILAQSRWATMSRPF